MANRLRLPALLVLLMLLLTGCGLATLPFLQQHTTNGPFDPLAMLTAGVTPPVGATAGVQATFTAQITGGVAPYTVAWDFGGGGTPNTLVMTNQPTTSSATTQVAAGDWSVQVIVTDSLGLTVTMPAVSYHVSGGS